MRISDWSSDVCSSDLYGSDAIAGTINVITKHDYQGITLDAQYGISEAGDGRDFRIRGLAGYNFAGGRGNITVAGEYNQEAGLTNFARPGNRRNSFFTTPPDDSPLDNCYICGTPLPTRSDFGAPLETAFIPLFPT